MTRNPLEGIDLRILQGDREFDRLIAAHPVDIDLHPELRRAGRLVDSGVAELDEEPEVALLAEQTVPLDYDFRPTEREGIGRLLGRSQRMDVVGKDQVGNAGRGLIESFDFQLAASHGDRLVVDGHAEKAVVLTRGEVQRGVGDQSRAGDIELDGSLIGCDLGSVLMRAVTKNVAGRAERVGRRVM